MVLFTVWFIMFENSFVSSLVVGYACYWVCQFVGWEVMFGIGFVCLLVGGYVIKLYLLTLGMVSVLDFFITDLKQSHGF